jgi:pyruvate dehydrogenase E2 component (dihydrolipoamide acetyltransferase)
MKYFVPMPSLGADMDQGKLMKWLIKPGDEIKKGQAIAVVETTKSTVEIESFKEGKVLELIGKEGEEIRVGSSIATFEIPEQRHHESADSRLKVSPAARRLAITQGIKLEQVVGSGPGASIELRDIEKLITPVKTPEKTGTGVNLRAAIAQAMGRSKKEIPHYYLRNRVSLDRFMAWIDEKNANLASEQRLMIPVALLRAVTLALQENPAMNGYFEKDLFSPKESIHLGMTIALKQGGVLVPAILDSQQLSVSELNLAFQDLLQRARKGELKNRELTEGTFTVSYLGDLGCDEVLGIIFPPQVALLGLGRIHKEAVVVNGVLRVGFVIQVTLSADHRVSDGLIGARFLASIEKFLTNPHLLEEQNAVTRAKTDTQRDLPGSLSGDSL